MFLLLSCEEQEKGSSFFFFFCYVVQLELRIVSLLTIRPTHREEICEKEKKEEKKKMELLVQLHKEMSPLLLFHET